MKKLLLIAVVLLSAPLGLVFAQTPAAPTPSNLASPFLLSLIQHVVAETAFTTRGQTKLEFLDGVAQFGRYQKDYMIAADIGFVGSADYNANMTYGIHAHLVPLTLQYITVSPDLQSALQNIEVNVRESYDMDEPQAHRLVTSVTVGAHIPFGGQ